MPKLFLTDLFFPHKHLRCHLITRQSQFCSRHVWFLFIFKPDKSIEDGRETVKWMVQNLHGSRMKEFWEKANSEKQEPSAEKRELNAGDSEIDAECEEMGALNDGFSGWGKSGL
ncbi:hypothetical protein LC613_31200 [Nostoc sphaeroides CHAB 2801]|uniref:hypothetical protein n=1 Tax=Nostoc sphaeroides TaxID=446679 RepID=UPI001E60B6F3|nr:hypothetical protein [Nostoc sphaeroides]MCC5632135.1 hypothetical protein [Nostoc sphaeroides CHAB 2801]